MNTWSRSSKFAALVTVFFLSSFAVSCGGGGGDDNGGGGPTPTEGALLVQITDAPLDNLLKFEITIVSIELDPGDVVVLSSSQAVRVELSSLQLTSAVLRLVGSIPTGSYNRVTVQFSNPEIKFCPELPQLCGTPTVVSPPLTNSTVEETVSFSVSGSSGTALLIDFDLEASIETNALGGITGVDPQFTITDQTLGAEDDEFEAKGRVLEVTRASATAGTFVLEVFGSCQRITVEVDSGTDFEDFDDAMLSNNFESLAVDHIVEVEGDAETNGAVVANTVELEEPDDDEEAEGTIIAEVRGGGGLVTSFTLLVQELGTCATGVLTTDTITVAVNTSTQFEIDENDLPGLSTALFDTRDELAVGQKVEVEPTGLLGTSITAEKIQLKEQTVHGIVLTFGATTFTMIPRSSLITAAQINVETSAATEFDGVSGVGELGTNRPVRVRGVLVFVGGQYTLVASRVEALPFS